MALFALTELAVPPARAQAADTTAALVLAPQDEHSPRGALWRSLVLPGWGQFYNEQYYKIPFVYAGLGGLGYLLVDVNSEYFLYKHAHAYKRGVEDPDTPPSPQYEDEYQQILAMLGREEVSASFLQRQREELRSRRDLSILGLGLFYALTVLDAYVSAHLFSFDVGEDLSARIYPTPAGPAATLRVRF